MDVAEQVASVVRNEVEERAWRFLQRMRWHHLCSISPTRTNGEPNGFWIRSRDQRQWKIDVMILPGGPLWVRRFSWGKEREQIRIGIDDPSLLDKARSTLIKFLLHATEKQRHEVAV